MIKIDGSYKEGGGQIVRTALALSLVTGKAFEVDSIRKGRCSPGLKHQHLYCIKGLQELSNAQAEGAEIGSERIKFTPGKIKARNISIDIETAGSITLLLQSLIIPCIFAEKPVTIDITGGTDVAWSMPVDYLSNVLLPHLDKYADIKFTLLKRGYYPKGGGKIEIKIKPKFSFENRKEAPKIDLVEQGHLMQIKGISHASADLQKAQVADRQARTAESTLKQKFKCPMQIRAEYCSTLSAGSGIALWAIFSKDMDDIDSRNPIRICADSLGERGKPAENVGKEAAERLINEISYGAPVDEYLADNLIPFLGLFGGRMKIAKISNHTLTNIYVAEKFLDARFEVDEKNRVISVNR